MEPRTPNSDVDVAEQLMKPSEVASEDNVSVKTVYRWIEKGLLPAHKLGGQWRISRRAHRNFLRERWYG